MRISQNNGLRNKTKKKWRGLLYMDEGFERLEKRITLYIPNSFKIWKHRWTEAPSSDFHCDNGRLISASVSNCASSRQSIRISELNNATCSIDLVDVNRAPSRTVEYMCFFGTQAFTCIDHLGGGEPSIDFK